MATPEEIRRAREASAFGGIFNNLFAANRRTANQLVSEGRRPVLGGLASKQRGVAGTDTLRFEGFAPFFGNLLDPIIKGVDAPRAASQSLIPQEDMIGEAFGTAGTVAAGTGAAAGRSILDYDPATTRIFAGKRAAARSGEDRRAAIAEAERLFEQGMKNRDVYDRTGVFRGADGKLRFEIDDKASSVLDVVHGGTSMRLEDYLTHPELYDLYPSMRGMPVDFKPRQDMLGVRGSFSPSSQRITLAMDDPEQMRSTLLHEAQHAVQDREGFSGGSSTQYDYSKKQASDFATNLLSSPEAKNMYYQSQSFDQQFNQIRPLYKAQYIDKLNNLVQKALDGRAKPSEIVRFGDWYKYGDTIRSNLGPMPNRAGPARDNWIASAAAQLRDFNLEEMSDLERSLYDEARRTFDTPREINNAVKRIERKIEKHRAGAFGYRELANRAREVQDLNVIDAYLREAGEVEARNVQSRANPNNPQGFPLDTAEFLPNQQIISNLRAGQNLVDVSSSSKKPLGIMVLEQQARGNNRLGGLLESQGMDISDLSTASPAKIQSALDTAVKRGILDPRSAAGLKRGILDGL